MTRTKITLASTLTILVGLGAGVLWMVHPPATSGPLPAQIEQIVQAARDDELWGNVLVVRGDAVVYEQSSGTADMAADVQNERGTRFLIGSVSKPFTDASFAYSNTGYVCLALVVESVTGQPFASVLHERILAPAGMHDSGVLRSGAAIERLGVGYQKLGVTFTLVAFSTFAVRAE